MLLAAQRLSTSGRQRIASAAAAAATLATAVATARASADCEQQGRPPAVPVPAAPTAVAAAATPQLPDCTRLDIPSTAALSSLGGGPPARWALHNPSAAARARPAAGCCQRVTLADPDVVRCVRRTEPTEGALERAYDTHAIVYWCENISCVCVCVCVCVCACVVLCFAPNDCQGGRLGTSKPKVETNKWFCRPAASSPPANSTKTTAAVYEYGVVFIPGTGAGTGPAYRHRPARNKYPVSENGLAEPFTY
eukprot:COSAG06_NODE_84_length_25090_cov_20.561042_2_plen_251_part_00